MMKDAGVEEVQKIRRRALRLQAMGRIEEVDADYIVRRCNDLEVRIQRMWELDPDHKEF